MNSNTCKYQISDPESVLFWNERIASLVGGSKATPSCCNTQTVTSACQDLQSRAAAHQRSKVPQKPVPQHAKISGKTWLCNALHNHSIAWLDPLERFSDKRSFSVTCDPLQPTATCETFLAGSPQTRPSSSWLVGLSCRVQLRSCTMVSNPSAWSPTFFGKSQDGLTSADEPRTTKIIKLIIPSSSCLPCKSHQIAPY